MLRYLKAWKRLTSGSLNRRIFAATFTVGVLTALVKLLAVVKELVVAWRFGTGDELDAFFIALLVPAFIVNVVAGSFNTALIPTYVRVREQAGANAAQKLLAGTTVWSLGLLSIAALIVAIAAPLYLPQIASGFDPQKLRLTFELLVIIAPFILLNGLVVIWGAVLNAGERFALAAISPIVIPGTTILLLLFFKAGGTFALATGLALGSLLELILLGITLHRQGVSLLPRWYGFNPHLRQVANQYVPMMAGAFLMCSTDLVDQSMAAMLSPGSVAALNYGNKIVSFVLVISTTALGTAVAPYFSKMVAAEDWVGIRRTLKLYIKLIFLATLPLALIIIASSELIVQILFQRGSFTAKDTLLVAQIQSFYTLQLPFYVAAIFLVKLVSALRKNHILMYGSFINLIANISLNYLFMQRMGIAGIALSTSCVYLISFLFLSYFWLHYSKQIDGMLSS